jgi:hypothetical protein
MNNRYLGMTGEDNSIVEFKLADFGKGANEYFEEIGLIMTNGEISVTAPTQVGKIVKIRLLQRAGIYPVYNWISMRFWLFNKPTSTQVLRQMQNFTSTDMDGLIGFTDFKGVNYTPYPDTTWEIGGDYDSLGDNTMTLENIVDIPFVLDETQKIYIVGENIGDPRTYSDNTIFAYLYFKMD